MFEKTSDPIKFINNYENALLFCFINQKLSTLINC